MRRLVPKLLAIAAAVWLLASCINDGGGSGRGGDGGGKGKPTVVSFRPQMGGHGATRALGTYDETYEAYAEFFGIDPETGVRFIDSFGDSTPDDPEDDGVGNAADSRIASFRVLVFYADPVQAAAYDKEPGDIVTWQNEPANHLFDPEDEEEVNEGFEFELPTGTYDFLFVANDFVAPDNNVFGADGSTVNCSDLDAVRAALFTFGAGDAGQIHSSKPVPMATWIGNVEVDLGKISFTDLAGRYGTRNARVSFSSTWDVWMERAAIRLSFGIHMGREQYEAWRAHHGAGDPLLYIDGLRESGHVYPDGYDATDTSAGNSDHTALPTQPEPASADYSDLAAVRPGKIRIDTTDGSADVFFDRLIYPEHLPLDARDPATALRALMRFDYGSRQIEKEIAVHAADPATSRIGYALPRNTWVWTKADVLTDVTCISRVVPWGNGSLPPVEIGQWTLTTDHSEFLFRAVASSRRMEIFTDHRQGWTASVPADHAAWLSISPGSGATGESLATISVTDNTSDVIRIGYIHLRVGTLTRTIVVTQLPSGGIADTPDPPVDLFVGAFWKASQYGERLIDVARHPGGLLDGAWAAYVIEGEEWIVLDTTPSDRAGEGNAAGFDAARKVPGFATSVSGTVGTASPASPGIYFRIGLNGTYTPTVDRPARYGVILLSYTRNGQPAWQRVWVRQGEGADYVMRPGDANSTPVPGATGATPRPLARRFSPYNLTAEGFTGAGSTTPAVTINPRSDLRNYTGTFTDYPSQAGAIFRWGHTEGVRAFNPAAAISAAQWGGTTNTVTGAWDDISLLYESCPPGWRRPVDGTTSTTDPAIVASVPVEESEMFQSLLLAAEGTGNGAGNTGNSVWGYYADGYFDRKHTAAAVSAGGANSAVAYRGRLFYNPDGQRSLFLPAAGERHGSTGAPGEAGEGGYYWSSSASFMPGGSQGGASWLLGVTGTAAQRFGAFARSNGLSIRCVVDDDLHSGSVFTATTPGAIPHTGGTGTFEVVSTNPDGFTLPWVVTGYDTDGDGNRTLGTGFDDTRPVWLDLPEEGAGGNNASPEPVDVMALASRPTSTSPWDTALQGITTPVGSFDSPRDLSYDFDSGQRNTANSYVVNAPGHYKLPLIYGNAVQGGIVTTSLYGPTFVDHNGTPISSSNISGATDAVAVWMDSPGLVDNVRLADNKTTLAFEVPSHTILQGNAIVAARDGSGNIMWSWHIWVTHESVFDATPATPGSVAPNTFSVTGERALYRVMRYNLGWVGAADRSYPPRSVTVKITQAETGRTEYVTVTQQGEAAADNTLGRNPYYQWGRKDPMPSVQTNADSPVVTLYGPGWTTRGAASALREGIRNPGTFFGASEWWGTGSYPDLWDLGNFAVWTPLDIPDKRTSVKTLYDPSPVGYRVPVADIYSTFAAANPGANFVWGTSGGYAGRTFTDEGTGNTSFFHAAGRISTGSDRTLVNSSGYYWSAMPHSGGGSMALSFGSTGLETGFSGGMAKGFGYPVRAVADEIPATPPPRYPRGVHAPPGVIGYISTGDGYGQLTLRGSSVYLDTAADTQANRAAYGGAPLEVPVYVAYFKFGSLVPLTSEISDISAKSIRFNADDIVDVPGETFIEGARFMVGQQTNAAAMDDVQKSMPIITPGGGIVSDAASFSMGLGDPCVYYFNTMRWTMPSGAASGVGWAEGVLGTGTNNALPRSVSIDYETTVTQAWTTALPENGLLGSGGSGSNAVGQNWYQSMFMPAAGYRDPVDGAVTSQGTGGYYWSRSAQSSTIPYSLSFTSGSTNAVSVSGSTYDHAYAVRCVQPTPSPAGEWVVGDLIWSGSNVIFDNTFGDTPEEATNVFWWGSNEPKLANATSGNNTTSIAGGTPWIDTPCPWGWRLPTKEEMDLFVAQVNLTANVTPGGVYVTGSSRFPIDDGSKLFFPALGYTQGKNGSPGGANEGHYWTSTTSGDSAYKLFFVPGTTNGAPVTGSVPVHVNTSNKQNEPDGMAVRCVRSK